MRKIDWEKVKLQKEREEIKAEIDRKKAHH
jgi:hypothetical protein